MVLWGFHVGDTASVGAGLVPARWPIRANVRGGLLRIHALLGIWAGTGPAPTSAVCLTHTISCRTLQFIESMLHSNGTNKRKLNDNTRYSLTSILLDLFGSLKRNSYVWAINEKIWKKRGIPICYRGTI